MNKVKQSLTQKEYQRISNNSNDKSSFIARNVALNYLLLFLLYPIAAIYSAFTQGSALFVYLDRVINNALTATIFTVLVAIIIEIAKYFFGRAVSDDVRQHVWSESTNHIAAFVLKAIAFVGVFAFSITLSLTGAPDVAQDYRETTLPIADKLIKTDSIQNYYDAKIEAERSDIAKASTMTWKGAIVSDGRSIIKTAKANIIQYENQAQEALKQAQAENTAIKTEYEAETATAGNWLTGFAGLGEALAIIILLFVGNYQSGAEREVFAQATNGKPYTQKDISANIMQSTPNTFSENNAPERKRIGFVLPTTEKRITEKPDPSTTEKRITEKPDPSTTEKRITEKEVIELTDRVKDCENCGERFAYYNSRAKYCSDKCRIEAWEKRTGKSFNKVKK